MKISPNFTLSELTKSQTALRLGIANQPDREQINKLKALVEKVLQPARNALGPITINSGYRSPALNRAIGGSMTSQHTTGEAADIEGVNVTNLELAQWIAANCEFDQLILEGFDGTPNGGWVHVSYKANGGNRRQEMTATFMGGKVIYANVKMTAIA